MQLQFYPSGEADEVEGLESVVEAWLEGLWSALKKAASPGGAQVRVVGPPLDRCGR